MSAILFVIFCVLQLADAYTTWRVLDAGGSERNKPLAMLMLAIGVVPALAVYKLAVVAIVGLVSVPTAVLFILVVLYVAVVINNVMAMRKQRAA